MLYAMHRVNLLFSDVVGNWSGLTLPEVVFRPEQNIIQFKSMKG